MPSQGQCCHDHDCGDTECGAAYSLYQNIDLSHVTCLNEAEMGSCQLVFKPWGQRTDFSGMPLKSNDGDAELLLQIPFTGSVNLRAICVIGGPDGTCPSKLRAYINRDLDFETVQDLPALQEWDLQEDFRGVLEYPTTAYKFKGVHTLSLHFPETLGDTSHSEIHFIGLKGEFIERRKEAVEAVYESKPMPEDHQVPGDEQGGVWRMGM